VPLFVGGDFLRIVDPRGQTAFVAVQNPFHAWARGLVGDVVGLGNFELAEFAYAGGGLGKGGKVTLYTDGENVGDGEIPATLAMIFSADDGCDVGEDTGAPVSQDYGPRGNAFNGRVKGVQIAIAGAAEADGYIVSPEEAIRIAMARQ
jgi:hypothetical protein